jgi:hypothetical protein
MLCPKHKKLSRHDRCPACVREQDLGNQLRLMEDVALSAIALRMCHEHGFPLNFDALDRDLAALERTTRTPQPKEQ